MMYSFKKSRKCELLNLRIASNYAGDSASLHVNYYQEIWVKQIGVGKTGSVHTSFVGMIMSFLHEPAARHRSLSEQTRVFDQADREAAAELPRSAE